MELNRRILLLLALNLSTYCQAQVAIGEWRDHLTYRKAISLTEGAGTVYVATFEAVFSVELGSGEIARLTKANGLSDIGISTIKWNHDLGALVVAYANGNLDLVREDRSFNLNDINISNVIGSKAIHDIYFQGPVAYLSCGFGVVVMDLAAREVRETWLLGPGGTNLRVDQVVFHQDSIYTATEDGLFSAPQNHPNLTAFSSWRRRMDFPQPAGPVNLAASYQGKLLVNFDDQSNGDDTLYYHDGSGWSVASEISGFQNRNLHVSSDGQKLTVAHGGHVTVHDASLAEVAYTSSYNGGVDYMVANEALSLSTGEQLIADDRFGLIRSQGGGNAYPTVPNGPHGPDLVKMDASDGVLYIATGRLASNWNNEYEKTGVFYFVDGQWGFKDRLNHPPLEGVNEFGGSVVDIIAVKVDPNDHKRVYFGSWDEGVVEFYDRQLVQIYNQDNSSLQIHPGWDPDKVNVAGIDLDGDGNLWVTNAHAEEFISVRTTDGAWRSFTPGTLLNGQHLVGDIMVASNGYKWIIRPRNNGMLVFSDNGTIADPNDDQYQVISTFEGEGGLPDINVLSMAEDPDGEIWIGTGKGIAVFYNPDAIFSGGDFDAQQILIEQDGNVQILLETEAVSAIEVDGAGRKWIGTESSGAFLISDNGQEQVHHFTVENSPLPSNNILDIEIDGSTGDVFFATANGIMAYRGDATEGLEQSDCATVFPNPVQSTYTGPIAIDGLVAESDVKITDISGNLVYSTISKGGRAIWPGTDLNGERVATGVYLAMATDRFGKEKCMTKVLVVR